MNAVRPPGALPVAAGRPGAVPADSLPQIDLVSPQLRQDILAGKDVNLAALLIPGYKGQGSMSKGPLWSQGSHPSKTTEWSPCQ